MSTKLDGFTHIHVTEREGSHYHKNGAYDDAAWEDCTFMSFLEFLRATGHPEVPATHVMGENLRDASGRATTGGTNLFDCDKGANNLLGIDVPNPVLSTGIWAALTPGKCAAVQGAMAFPYGSHWRRWDPAFNGNHCVFVARLDATDRVWWCDPNAPARYTQADGTLDDWSGEWMSKADFLHYVASLSGYAIIDNIVADEASEVSTVITVLPAGGTYVIPANGPVTGFQFDPATGTMGATKAWTPVSTPSSGHYDATMSTTALRGSPFLRCTDGFFAPTNGQPWYISAGSVTETPNTVGAYTKADLDAAVAAQKAADDKACISTTAAAVSAATASYQSRITGIKTKVAAAAADIAND